MLTIALPAASHATGLRQGRLAAGKTGEAGVNVTDNDGSGAEELCAGLDLPGVHGGFPAEDGTMGT